MSKPVVALVGANGQLGQSFRKYWETSALANSHELRTLSHQQIDIADADAVNREFDNFRPSVIVNAAAYTAVDKAETEAELASEVNHLGPKHLAMWANSAQARLIHISTDFVFDGCSKTPYRSTDATAPLGEYGRSKLAGEQAILQHNPDNSLIFRTSWLYSAYPGNFVATMLRLMTERDQLSVVSDQIGSPTSTHSLVELIAKAIVTTGPTGIYHCCDRGAISWYDFAIAIRGEALHLGLLKDSTPVHAIGTKDYPTPAKRPAYSVLNTTTTEADFSLTMQPWRERLTAVLSEIAAR